jgi:PAS domain S-box-containing protein
MFITSRARVPTHHPSKTTPLRTGRAPTTARCLPPRSNPARPRSHAARPPDVTVPMTTPITSGSPPGSRLESGSGLLAYIDAAGLCTWVSPPAGTHMGWTTAWTVGRSLSELIHPDHKVSAPSRFILDLWDAHAGRPTPYRAADGRYHWMTISVSPQRGVPGYKRDGLLIRFSPTP